MKLVGYIFCVSIAAFALGYVPWHYVHHRTFDDRMRGVVKELRSIEKDFPDKAPISAQPAGYKWWEGYDAPMSRWMPYQKDKP